MGSFRASLTEHLGCDISSVTTSGVLTVYNWLWAGGGEGDGGAAWQGRACVAQAAQRRAAPVMFPPIKMTKILTSPIHPGPVYNKS